MAYFSSGTEGADYKARYCLRCANHRDLNDGRGAGCPIWDAHLFFNGDTDGARKVLDALIPREGLGNGECKAFLPAVSR